jgi:hypothetical protein
MATAFEPSLSSSLHRQTAIATGPSIVDSLPSINFGFDDLRDRMAKFTTKFDAFIEQGRKGVLEERNLFRMNVAELQGSHPPQETPAGRLGASLLFARCSSPASPSNWKRHANVGK